MPALQLAGLYTNKTTIALLSNGLVRHRPTEYDGHAGCIYSKAVGVGAAGAAEAAPLFQPAYLGIILLLDGCYSATTTIFSQKLN